MIRKFTRLSVIFALPSLGLLFAQPNQGRTLRLPGGLRRLRQDADQAGDVHRAGDDRLSPGADRFGRSR